MRIIKILLLKVCLTGTLTGYAQGIFPEKFDGCITDQFALESDTITARTQDEHLIDVIRMSFDSKMNSKIRGTLSLQIIVDLDGNSCLISLQNDTNIKIKNLNLKQYIDKELKWEKPYEKVAAIVLCRFVKNGVEIKRIGMNGKRGMQELSLD